MIFREAALLDVPGILEIVNHEILHSTVLYEYEPRTLEQQTDWLESKQKDGWPIFVAEHNEQIVGFGTYGPFRARAAYQKSVEHSAYVHKDFRGKTIGYQLMLNLIESAKQRGFHTMIAGIDSSNKGSVEFHRKFGFEIVGTFKEVGYKFDRWLDVTFMQLLLH